MTGLALPLTLLSVAAAASTSQGLPVKLETRTAVTSRLANVHLSAEGPVDGPITVTYGPCSSSSAHDAHHIVGGPDGGKTLSTRLVWVLPEDTESGGCISAWDSAGTLVGRSEPQHLQQRHKRRDKKRAGMLAHSAYAVWCIQKLTHPRCAQRAFRWTTLQESMSSDLGLRA